MGNLKKKIIKKQEKQKQKTKESLPITRTTTLLIPPHLPDKNFRGLQSESDETPMGKMISIK